MWLRWLANVPILDLRFWQRSSRRFMHSGVWRHVDCEMLINILGDLAASFFSVREIIEHLFRQNLKTQFFCNTTLGHCKTVTEVSVVIAASFFRTKESNQIFPSQFSRWNFLGNREAILALWLEMSEIRIDFRGMILSVLSLRVLLR